MYLSSLTRSGFDELDAIDSLGWPPLMWAASYGSVKLIKEPA